MVSVAVDWLSILVNTVAKCFGAQRVTRIEEHEVAALERFGAESVIEFAVPRIERLRRQVCLKCSTLREHGPSHFFVEIDAVQRGYVTDHNQMLHTRELFESAKSFKNILKSDRYSSMGSAVVKYVSFSHLHEPRMRHDDHRWMVGLPNEVGDVIEYSLNYRVPISPRRHTNEPWEVKAARPGNYLKRAVIWLCPLID